MTAQLNFTVLIIGAGISGLSLARLCAARGIFCILFEATTRLAPQGYGITARAWAYDPVLAELGISVSEFKAKTATDGPVGGVGKMDLTMYELQSGIPMLSPPKGNTGSPESDKFRANRNYLREFLMEGVDVRFEHELSSVRLVRENGKDKFVEATFKNGQVVKGDYLIGADGVHSFGKYLSC